MIGKIHVYGNVWYDATGIENILLLAQLVKNSLNKYNILNFQGFVVQQMDIIKKIPQSHNGLHYYDTSNLTNIRVLTTITVEGNKSKIFQLD